MVRGFAAGLVVVIGLAAAALAGCGADEESGGRADPVERTEPGGQAGSDEQTDSGGREDSADRAESSGQGESGEGATSDGPGESGLQVTLQRSTLFETQRALRLALVGDGERDRRIAGFQLHSPLFEAVPPEDREAVLGASTPVLSIGLPYGAPRCDAEADGPAELAATLDGEEVRLEIEEQPADLLADLHGRECAALAVFEDVELSFADRWEHTAPRTAETEIVLAQRRDGVTAVVERLEGNVVFTLETETRGEGEGEGEPEPVLEVGDDQPSARVGVVIRIARCDAHGIIEYKRKYFFVAWVRLGDADPVRVDLEAVGPGQQTLASLLPECQ